LPIRGFLHRFDNSIIIDPEKLISCREFGKNLFVDKIEAKEKFGVKS
jgi:hypothetical protein